MGDKLFPPKSAYRLRRFVGAAMPACLRIIFSVATGGLAVFALLLVISRPDPEVLAAPPELVPAAIITSTTKVYHTTATTHQMSVWNDGRITDQFRSDNGRNQVDQTPPYGDATTIAVMFDQHPAGSVDVAVQGEFAPRTPITLYTAPDSNYQLYNEDTYVVYASRVLSYEIAQRTLATSTNNCVIMELELRNTGGISLTGGRLLYMIDLDAAHHAIGDLGFYDPSRRLVYVTDYNITPYRGFAIGISLLEGSWRGYGIVPDSDPRYPNPSSDTRVREELLNPTNTITDYGGAGSYNLVPWVVADIPTLIPEGTAQLAFGICANTAYGPPGIETEYRAAARMKTSFDLQAALSFMQTTTPPAGSHVVAGMPLTWLLAISSTGYRYVDNIVVTYTLPGATELITYNTGQGNIQVAGHQITATVGRLYPTSATVTITFVMAPSVTATSGTIITHQAFINSEPIVTHTSPVTHLIVNQPALTLTKQVVGPLIAGVPFTYALSITNTGQGIASGVVVTDRLPEGAYYVTGGTLMAGSFVSWTIPQIPFGENRQVTFVVTTCRTGLLNEFYRVITSTQGISSEFGTALATALAPPTLIAGFDYSPSTVTVRSIVHFTSTSTTNGPPLVSWSWDFGDGSRGDGAVADHAYTSSGLYTMTFTVTDSCGYSDTVSKTLEVYAPWFAVLKSVTPSTALAGEALTYTIVVTNQGFALATGVVITDVLPAGTTLVTATLPYTSPQGGVITWTLDMLEIGARHAVTIVLFLDESVEDAYITNTAWLSCAQGITAFAVVTTPVQTQADLSLEKEDRPDPAGASSRLTYTLNIRNDGPSLARQLWVTDVLPAGVAYGSASGSGWSCGYNNGTVNCTRSTLSTGIASSIVITVNAPLTGGLIVNTASIDAATPDPDPGDNPGSAETLVIATADLALTKSVVPTTAVPGQVLTYTLVYTNYGPGAATSVLITDVVPAFLMGVSWTSSGVAVTPTGGITYAWQVADLSPGAGGTIFVSGIVTRELITDVVVANSTVITTTAVTTTHDMNPANNSAVVTGHVRLPRVAFSSESYGVDEDAGQAIITVTMDAIPWVTATVEYATSDLTAQAVSDYAAVSGTLAFGPGKTVLTFTVPISDDNIAEGPESFRMLLSNAARAAIEGGQSIVTIADDDAPPAVGFAQAVYGVEEGAGHARITVTLSHLSAFTVSVDYAARDGSAIAPHDYVPVSGTLVFPPCDYIPVSGTLAFPPLAGSGVFTVPIVDDGVDEPEETVELALARPVNATPGRPFSATLVIADDDEPLGWATIYGAVFLDVDVDGVQDEDERGIAGVLITLDSTVTATTDLDGRYAFTVTTEGIHTVTESNPVPGSPWRTAFSPASPGDNPGYFSTTPDSVNVLVLFGHNYRVDFGDAPVLLGLSSIYGIAFEDADGDGEQDRDEPGLPGVLIVLDQAVTTTTDLNGSYTFGVRVQGMHTVAEVEPEGYFATTPSLVNLLAVSGFGYQVDFGNARAGSRFASIHGVVFNDIDANGIRDTGEPGIRDVPITLDGGYVFLTDGYGRYAFSTAVTGAHTVLETDLSGYSSTTPNEVTVEVSPGNGYQVDFGDVETGSCLPDIYEHDDAPAQASAIVVGTTQPRQFCDDPTDWVRFQARRWETYTITTSFLRERADTVLTLFDADGCTVLVENDDCSVAGPPSCLTWRAPRDGIYYVLVSNKGGVTGVGTDYALRIENSASPPVLYLPVVMRNSSGRILIYLPLVLRR